MTEDSQRVQKHFDRRAGTFDAIYSGEKSPASKWLDRLLRWDMQERLRLTLEACRPIDGKTVLDVGCGTGRYSFALAQAGAAQVVGLDFAPTMIERAKTLAQGANLSDRCTFACGDILQHPEKDKFDYVVAVGLFDYVKDDRHLLTKLRHLTGGKLVATFPRADTWRAPLRKIRLSLLGCPVYFYTEKRIRDHLLITGFMLRSIKKVGKLYFVEAN